MKLNKEYYSLFALWIISKDFGMLFFSLYAYHCTQSQTHSANFPTLLFTELQLGDTDKPLKLLSTWKKFTAQFKRSKGSTPTKARGHQDQDLPAIYLRRNVFYPVEREKTVRVVHC